MRAVSGHPGETRRGILKWMVILFFIALGVVQDDVRGLVESLRSESVVEREDAYRKLKAIGRPALKEIARAAAEGDDEASGLAKRLLKVIPILESLPPGLAGAMPSLEERVADRADGWSRELVGAVVRPEKFPGLRHRDLESLALEAARSGREVREVCQVVLQFRLRAALPELARHLAHEAPEIRAGVALTLGDMHARASAGAIEVLLKDPSPPVRASAATALGALKARSSIPALVPLLEDREREVRRGVAAALAGMGAKEALPALLKLAAGEDFRNIFAVDVLVESDLEGTRPALLRLLRDPNVGVGRERLVGALAQLRGREELVGLLSDGDAVLRRLAALRLGAMGVRDSIPELRRIGGWDAATLLYRMGEKDPLPHLLAPLKQPASDLRIGALRDLAALGVKEALPEIRPLLDDVDPEVQAAARRAAAVLEGRPLEAAPAAPPKVERTSDLVGRLRSPERSVRDKAIEAIERQGGKEVPGAFLELLEGEIPEERQAAIEALERLGFREAAPAIAARLKDPVMRVRLTAAASLCRWGRREGVPLLLEERANLTPLNAVRDAGAWEKLRAARMRHAQALTSPAALKEDLLRWAYALEIKAVWEAGSKGDLALWSVQLDLPRGDRQLSCGDPAGELESFMDDGRYGAILEAGVVRIVPYDEAWDFWKSWWDRQPK